MSRKALGRGLSALLGEETIIVAKEELLEISFAIFCVFRLHYSALNCLCKYLTPRARN